MDVTPNYLHQILSGYCADPFANFRPLFKAILRRATPSAGRAIYDDLRSLYLAEMQRRGTGVFAPDAGSLPRCHKETFEAIQARIQHRPPKEQLREIDEAIEEWRAARFRVLERMNDRGGAAEDEARFS